MSRLINSANPSTIYFPFTRLSSAVSAEGVDLGVDNVNNLFFC